MNFENWTNGEPQVLYMSFDKFLLAVESRDLSQADKRIIRVSSFPSWVMGSRTFFSVSTTDRWMFCKMNALNPLKFTSHKKNWGKMIKFIKTSILPNRCQIGVFGIIVFFLFIFIHLRKKTLLYYSCQLEIDHGLNSQKKPVKGQISFILKQWKTKTKINLLEQSLGPEICRKYFLSFPQKNLSPEKIETN